MSSVPAWKRAGLSVKAQEEDDESLSTKRIENADLTTKEIKKISNKRKLQEDSKHKSKKPPKRIKLPKKERPPPPVKDQLTYLKQFQDDKDNWKFNKSKQNWILKNIKDIPEDYEPALVAYLGTLQGGSRDRLIPELKEVISKWNTQYEEAEKKIEEQLNKKLEGEEPDKEEKKEEKEESTGVTLDYALRCKAILVKLDDDEDIEVKGQ
ncbi:hypothetical protein G210_0276 [Candida maltosa Xu316]|uniref:WKF domain-containing protein n=1 Tax=Candida maltosa (strain Xu316) TaxID=1245528 RepID=M3JAB6_CANMX|nr:hypothetical protein G210_0276 [Candida maltosa Xu316]